MIVITKPNENDNDNEKMAMDNNNIVLSYVIIMLF